MRATDAAARSRLDGLVRIGKSPGIQYLAVRADDVVFEYAEGWADIAGRRRMDPATTMMAYSMSKTVTAAAVLQLVEARRVELDAPIDSCLDRQPYGPDVTVRQLLSHTSGIPNPIPLRWVHSSDLHKSFDDEAALASVLLKYPKLSSPPGTKYGYSNIGYWLLGRIVEQASGESFASYVRAHVLEPLGIAPQELGYEIVDPSHHAKGYLEKWSLLNLCKRVFVATELIGGYEDGWLRLNGHHVNGAAFGGLVGTARGFGKFLQDQLRPHSGLFTDNIRRQFYAPQCTKDAIPVQMTLGWNIGTARGARCFYKEGGGGGFHSMMRIYESRGVATVVMTNATNFDVSKLLDELDCRFV